MTRLMSDTQEMTMERVRPLKMVEDDGFDSMKCGERMSKMWMGLAELIENAIPDIVIAGDPAKAILWATCAEACFWKATGDADTHDVKDVLAARPTPAAEGG